MADIKLDIEVNGTRQLKQAADQMLRTGNVSRKLAKDFSATAAANARLVKETRRVESVKKQLRKAVKDEIISSNQATRALNEEIRKAKERVLTDKTLIDQAKKRAKAAEELRKETDRLTRAYAPARAAEQQYAQVQREIQQAHRRGIITLEEMQTALASTAKQYNEFRKGIATGGNQFAKFNLGVYNARQSVRKFGNIELQQVGYQVGDFFVQVQSGTDAMVAFGQQASQLAGVFGATGAIIGAGISIFTAVSGSLLRMAEDADGAKEKVDELRQSLESMQAQAKAAGFGVSTTELAFLDALAAAQLKYQEARQNYQDARELFEASKNDDMTEQDIQDVLYDDIKAMEEARKAAGDASQSYQDFLAARTSLISGANIDAFGGLGDPRYGTEEVSYLRDLDEQAAIASFERQAEAERALFAENAAYEQKIAKEREQDRLGLLADRGEAERKLAEENAAFESAQDEKRSELRLARLKVSAALQAKGFQNQADAAAAAKKELEERAKAELDLYEENLRYEKRQEQLRQKELDRQNKINTQARAALAVDQARERLSYAQLQYGKDSERARMYELALAEIQVREAEKLKGTNSDIVDELVSATRQHLENKFLLEDQTKEAKELEAALRAARRAFATVDISQIPGEEAAAATQQQRIDELKKAWEDFKNKRDKGSAKTLTNIQDTIDALKEQTAQERKLLGLTGERLKEEEIFYDLVQANKDADIKLSEKKLRAIAEEIAAQQEANEMYEKAIGFVDDISDAFSDFVASGLKDFKDFVGSIKDMFVRLLADLAAQAVRNRILIPITTGLMAGAGNAAASTIAGSGMGSFAAGTIGASLAGYGSALGAGFTTALGFGTSTTGATAMALHPTMASIGAALPAIIAVAAVVGLLTKKTKLLDSGLRATVKGFDVAIETFQLTQSSRLFGLLKGSKKTTFTAADAEVADPIISAINKMQESIVDAAGTLGIGAEAFEHFTYQFKVSLKGLSEEEQLRKVNEEITKMGDAFAELSGHFSTMNELLQVAQQRYDLETRLLQLQGDATALLARQREREIASTHELNQGILAQIHAVEDAQIAAQQAAVAVDVAFATVQRSIQARKDVITRAFNDLMENIQLKIDEANENVSVSRSVLGLLEGATSARIGMTREAGLEYLQGLRGASRITDQKKLDKALKAISDPSEDLYTNFVDYQRDFADQSNLVRDLEKTAKHQLGTDEQTLLELQDQADAAETRHQEQLDALDAQLDKAQQQIDVMRGVDTSVKSVEQAIADLGVAIQAAMSAQQAAKAAANVKLGTGTDKGMAGVIQANSAGQKILEQLGQSGVAIRASDQAKFQKIQIRGAEQLLEVANQLGVKTSGKSGAEIQQAISNAGNLGVNMDNATRAKAFALGGYFAGGLRMVGERGPELEMTGPSRIMSNNDTRKMLQNPDLVEAVKGMRQEIAELRSEQRQLGINNNKYTKRTYDLYRQWDTEGLPAERT